MAEVSSVEALALEAIDRNAQADELLEPDAGSNRVPFSLLYKYVCGDAAGIPDDFHERLKRDPRALRDLESLSAKVSRAEIGAAAAAASTRIDERVSPSATLRIRSSTTRPNQVFVEVEFANPDQPPAHVLIVVDEDDNWYRLTMVPYDNVTSQGIADDESLLVEALRNPRSRIRLS